MGKTLYIGPALHLLLNFRICKNRTAYAMSQASRSSNSRLDQATWTSSLVLEVAVRTRCSMNLSLQVRGQVQRRFVVIFYHYKYNIWMTFTELLAMVRECCDHCCWYYYGSCYQLPRYRDAIVDHLLWATLLLFYFWIVNEQDTFVQLLSLIEG